MEWGAHASRVLAPPKAFASRGLFGLIYHRGHEERRIGPQISQITQIWQIGLQRHACRYSKSLQSRDFERRSPRNCLAFPL
jgi:hypothetical protein